MAFSVLIDPVGSSKKKKPQNSRVHLERESSSEEDQTQRGIIKGQEMHLNLVDSLRPSSCPSRGLRHDR